MWTGMANLVERLTTALISAPFHRLPRYYVPVHAARRPQLAAAVTRRLRGLVASEAPTDSPVEKTTVAKKTPAKQAAPAKAAVKKVAPAKKASPAKAATK